jgi:hypothetical protein
VLRRGDKSPRPRIEFAGALFSPSQPPCHKDCLIHVPSINHLQAHEQSEILRHQPGDGQKQFGMMLTCSLMAYRLLPKLANRGYGGVRVPPGTLPRWAGQDGIWRRRAAGFPEAQNNAQEFRPYRRRG